MFLKNFFNRSFENLSTLVPSLNQQLQPGNQLLQRERQVLNVQFEEPYLEAKTLDDEAKFLNRSILGKMVLRQTSVAGSTDVVVNEEWYEPAGQGRWKLWNLHNGQYTPPAYIPKGGLFAGLETRCLPPQHVVDTVIIQPETSR